MKDNKHVQYIPTAALILWRKNQRMSDRDMELLKDYILAGTCFLVWSIVVYYFFN